MANKYWVPGGTTTNWSDTTNWSLTSNGTRGAAVPTAADSVFFDSSSVYNVTMTGAMACLDFTVTNGDATFLQGTTPTLTIAGNITLRVTTVWSMTGAVTFTAATAKTINSQGVTINSPFTFNGVGGSWTLLDNLTFAATRQITLNNGTLDFNNRSVNLAAGMTINGGICALNNTGGTTVTISGPITHTSGILTLGTNLTTTSTTGYTLTAGNLSLSTFTLTTTVFSSANANARTLAFGTGKIVLNGSATATIWNTSTITSMTVTGNALVECIGGGTAVTKTISTGALSEANAINFSLLETSGTVTYAFTASNVVKNLIINGSQTVSNIAITIYGSFTHTTTNGTTTFTAGTNAWTFAATSGTYNITPASSIFTYDFPWTFGGAASTATWSLQNVVTIGATRAITFTNGTLDANNFNFNGGVGITMITGTFTLSNTGGVAFLTSLPITHTSGTLNLNTILTTTAAAGYTLTAGTLSLGSNILNTLIFSSANANTRTIAFGTGKIVINTAVTSTVWNTSTITGLTVTGTPLVECKGGGTGVTKTISPGSLSEANAISFSLLETTGTATYTITSGTSNIKNLIVNGSQTLSNSNIGIWGTFTHTTTNGTTTFTAGTNAWIFAATSGSYTIGNIAGFTYDFPWTFGSATSTATWTLSNNLTLGATRQLTLANGTFDMNNKTISAAGFTILTGTPTLANTGGSSPFTTSLPFTHTSGSFTLTFSITTTATTGYTLTAGTLNLGTYTLTVPVFSSSNSNTRTIAFGTGKIVVGSGGSGGTLVDMSTSTNLTTSGARSIDISYAGATAVTVNCTVAAPNSISFNFTTGTYSLTLGTSGIFGNLNFTGFSGTLVTGTYTINGSVTYSTTMSPGTLSNTAIVTFAGNMPAQTNYTITSNNYIHKHLVTVNMSTNTYTLTLQDNFNMDYSGTSGLFTSLTLTQGTFVLNNFSATLAVFSSNNSNVRGINYGTSGVLTIPGNNSQVWNTTTMTNFTSTGTPYVNFTYTGVNAINLVSGASETQVYDVSFGNNTSGFVFSTASVAAVSLGGTYGSINLTGFVCTIANVARTIYGNLTVPASGGTLTVGTNATTFGATSSTRTITTNGRTLDFPLTFSGTNTYTLQTALTVGTTRTVTLTSGTLNLNSLTLTTGFFNSSGSTARTLAFGTGQLALTASNATIFDMSTATNFSTTGTVYINCTYTGSVGTRVINTGFSEAQASAGYSISTSGTSGIILSPTATDIVTLSGNFYSINLTGFTGTLSNATRAVYGNWTNPASGGTYTAGVGQTSFIGSSPQTVTTNGRTLPFPFNFNSSSSTVTLQDNLTCDSSVTTVITSGTLNLNNRILTTGIFNASTLINRTLAFGTSGQLALTASGVTIFDMSTSTNFSTTGTVYINCTYTGSVGTRTLITAFTEAQAAAGYSISTSGTTGIILSSSAADTVALTGSFYDINLTGFTGTLSNTARTIYGNLTTPSTGGIIASGTLATTFGSSSSQTITSNSRILDFPITFNGTGTWTLQTALTIGSNAAGRITTLTAGTLNLNNYTLTVNVFNSSSSNARTLAFSSSGQLAINGNALTIFDITTATNFSTTGTAYVNCTYAGATGTRTIVTGLSESQVAQYSIATSGTSGIVLSSSATDIIALTGNFYNINLAGFVGTLSNTARTIYGNWSNPATGGTYTGGAVATTFGSTSSKIITTNGRTLDFALTFDGVGGTWTLQDNLTIGATRILTWNNGTLDLNNKTLSNPASITINGGVSGSFSLINTGGTLYTTSVALTHTSGGFNVSIPLTFGTYAMNGGSITLNNTLNTSAYTWTAGTITLNSYQLTCTTFTSTSTTARTFAFGTGNLTVTGSGACFNMLGATNQVITGTPNVNITNATTTATTVVSGVVTEAQSLNFIFSGGAYTLTFLATAGHTVRNVDFSLFSGTLGAVAACTIYGGFIGPSGTITASANTITFGGTGLFGNKTISTVTNLPFPVNFNGTGSYWVTGGIFNCDATHAMTFTNGTLDGTALQAPGITASSLTMTTGTFTMVYMWLGAAFTHTSGTLNVQGTEFALKGSTVATSTYTFTAGTINTSTAMRIGAFSSANLNTRAFNFNGGWVEIQTLITPVTSTAWNTVGSLGATTGWTTGGTSTPLITINTAAGQTTTVNPAIMSEAQSLSFTFAGDGTLNFLNTATYTARDVNMSSFSGTWSAISTCTIYGSFSLASTTVLTESASALTFGGATVGSFNSSKTFDTGGVAIKFPLIFNGTASTWTLFNQLTMGSTVARALTFVNGTFNFGSYVAAVGFTGSAISVNTGSVTLAGSNFGNIPFTLTSGTLTISDLAGYSYVGHSSNFTHTAGTLILNTNFYITDPNNTATYTYTFTAGTINLNNYQLAVTKFAATGATIRAIAFGTSGSIVVYPLSSTTGNFWDQTTIGTFSYTGTSDVRVLPGGVTTTVATGAASEAQSMNFTFGGSGPYTLNTTGCVFKNVTLDAYNDGTNLNVWNIGAVTIYGNYLETGCSGYGDRVFLPAVSASTLTFAGASGTKTLATRGISLQQPVTFNGASSVWQLQNDFNCTSTTTLTAGTLQLNSYNLYSALFNSSGTTARTIDFGTSTPGAGSAIIVKGNGTPFTTATATSLTLSGTYPLVKVMPTAPSGTLIIAGSGTEAQSFSYWFYNGDNSATYTLNFLGTAGYTAKDVDFTGGFTGTWAAVSTGTIYGNIWLYGGTISASASALTFGGAAATKTIQTNGVSVGFPITLNSVGSTFQLLNALTLSSATLTLTHTNGTLDLNGYTFSAGLYTNGVGTKNITFNGGTLLIIGSGATAFNNANPTGFTTSIGTTNTTLGHIEMSSASAKTFVGGGSTYNAIVLTTGTGTMTISGANTFAGLSVGNLATTAITGNNTWTSYFGNIYGNAGTLTLTAGTTQTLNSSCVVDMVGSPGNFTTINSATSGSLANISKSDGSVGSTMDYLSLKDVAFQPCSIDGSGTLPNIWHGGSGSVNLGNIFGITLIDWNGGTIYENYKTYVISNTALSSWTLPADWNYENNNIYLLGGGGGGGGSTSNGTTIRAAGGGGGGGGFTLIQNYSGRSNDTVPIAVGIAGTAGTGVAQASADATSGGKAGSTTRFGTQLSTLYAASFNGTNQYLQMPASFPITGGDTDCTVEAWIYPTSFSNSPIIIENAYQNSTAQGGWRLGLDTSGILNLYIAGTGASSFTSNQSYGIPIPLNTWTHVAFYRTSSYQGLYVNGSSSGLIWRYVTPLNQNSGGTQTNWNLRIGGSIVNSAFSNGFTGKISNVRVTLGTCARSVNFTPPRTTLDNSVSNTKLLTCHASTIIDGSTANSGSGYAITNNGNVTTTTSNVYLPLTAGGGGAGGSLSCFTPYLQCSSFSGDGGHGTYFGGEGWYGPTTVTPAQSQGGGGGGGAAGPYGIGGRGGQGFGGTANQGGGGGGGGNGGGGQGGDATSTVGGNGGNGYYTTGSGSGGTGTTTTGGNGTNGGGGAGGHTTSQPGSAAFGTDILNTWGGSGGAGGAPGIAPTNTVSYGGGGGGGGQVLNSTSPGSPLAGSPGGAGLIVIQYVPRLNTPGSPGLQNPTANSFLGFF